MKIVNTGNTYRTYDDSLKTYDQLPAQCYTVNFSMQAGFFLQKYDDIEVNEKIYGVHMTKLDKVMNTFKGVSRNFGIILSGDKGIGKSIFAKLLANRAVNEGYAVIIVNSYIPGIADYLAEIQQEVVVLFDEFDKSFGGDEKAQNEMLTLFDGLAQGKKLFAITCNNLNRLNEFLVNRPGRFHYHFRFDYPNDAEIREYLEDKIPESMYGEITEVTAFSHKVKLNYDCLRAIAFELSTGLPFKEAIQDLNILNVEPEYYDVTVVFNDGTKHVVKGCALDMFADNEERMGFYKAVGANNEYMNIEFNPIDAVYNYNLGGNVIDKGCLNMYWNRESWDWDNEEEKAESDAILAECKKLQVEYLLIRRKFNKNLHYAV